MRSLAKKKYEKHFQSCLKISAFLKLNVFAVSRAKIHIELEQAEP